MWNSPQRQTRAGSRYEVGEIAALTHPLTRVLNSLELLPVSDVVQEHILQRMDKEELIFGIYQVLEALLDDVPVPDGGHPGYHEAIIAELLGQTYDLIVLELEDPDRGDSARQAAWRSLERFCTEVDATGTRQLRSSDGLPVDLSNPSAYRSKEITEECWQDLLLGDGGLWSEFLWDDDWRMDALMDLPAPAAKRVTDEMGLNLDVVQKLPHTPDRAELIMAEGYIKAVIRNAEPMPGH